MSLPLIQKISPLTLLLPVVWLFPERAVSSGPYDFDFTPDTTGWIQSKNAAGLYQLDIDRVGRATASFQTDKGRLRDFNTARQQNALQVSGESWFRISPATLLYGHASYESATEQQVAGSVFMQHPLRSFDILISDTGNEGERKQEWYRIGAAVSHRITDRLALGASLNYHAGNMARTKDLRHTNEALDLTASLGSVIRLSERFQTGLSYSYKRYIEEVSFKTYGTTDQQHFTLVSFGAFYGKQEISDKQGYTSQEKTNPWIDNAHRIDWQISYRPTNRLTLFNELSYTSGSGYYGNKGSASVVHSEHDHTGWHDRLVVARQGNRIDQWVELDASLLSLSNRENTWRSETSSTGNSIIEYFGQNQVGEKKDSRIQAGYHIQWNDPVAKSWWRAQLSGAIRQRQHTAILFPWTREQKLSLYELQTGVIHHRNIGSTVWDMELAVGWKNGSGTPYTDEILSSSSQEGMPVSSDTYLQQEYDYLTATKVIPSVGLKVTLPVKNLGYYASLRYTLEQRIGVKEPVGRHFTGMTLGINF